MPINTTWSNPSTAGGSGGIDLATGDTLSETVWDRLVSNVNRLGGSDGNTKTGQLILEESTAPARAFSLQATGVVAHGMTSLAPTSAYYAAQIANGTDGGVQLSGFIESTRGVTINGYHVTDDTTKSTAGNATVAINGGLKSGTSSAALGANANILVLQTGTVTRFIFDSDGDSHEDVGTTWTNFDSYDDAALLNTLAAEVARPGDPIKDEFRSWLTYNRAALERARLVTFNDDGHHFLNTSRLAMLHTGAIRQLAQRLMRLETRLLPG